jgi:hypothetical protein
MEKNDSTQLAMGKQGGLETRTDLGHDAVVAIFCNSGAPTTPDFFTCFRTTESKQTVSKRSPPKEDKSHPNGLLSP